MKTIPQISLNSITIKWTVLTLLILAPFIGQAQLKLGDNAQNVNPNTIFELESTNKGILIPRMTDSQRDAAFTANIPNGLLIYNTTQNCFQYYQSSAPNWMCMGGTASGQLTLEGNILSLNGGSVELPSSELVVETGESDTALITLGDSTPVTLKAGSNISLTESGNTITLSARSSGGGGGGSTGPQGEQGEQGPPGPQGPAGASGTGGSGTDSQTLTLSSTLLGISGGNSVDLAPINTDDQQITTFTLNASNTIILELEDGGTRQLTLPSALASGTLNTDNQTISLVGNNLTITNGNTVTFPATTDSQTLSISGNNLSLTNGGSVDLSGFTNTDSQTVTGIVSGTNLLLKLSNVATETLDLAPFAVDTNTDSQTVTGIVSGTNLLLKLSNVATETLDLAPFAVDTNTDSQTVTGIVSGTDLLLKLSNVATETLDLSSLTTTPTTLADSDGDTNIVVDNGTDPDTISFTVSNTEHFRMDGYRLEVLNSNNNMALGLGSLSNVTTGTHNVAVGNNTLSNNTIGTFNTAVGDTALQNNKASQNTALGGIAGSSLNTSNSINNTFLSNRADTTSGTIITNATALGANAVVTTSNTIQLGDTNVTLINTSATVSATAFRGDGSELTNIQFGLDLNNNFLVGTQMNSLSSTLQWYEGRHNFAVFNGALQNNVTGYQNIAIGENALNDNSTGFYNIALGVQAMTENTTGVSNIGLGYQVLYNNKGSYNIGIGSYALSDLILNYRNTGIGNAALSDATGNDNTSVGAWSLDDLVSGSENTALGSYAGDNLNTNNSNKNTFIGYRADTTSGTFISNSTAIGASAIVSTSHTFVMGDENVSKWAFGLPTTNTGNAIQVGDDATNGNGASLTSAGVWTNASSILFKTNFIDLDNEWILSKIKSLNVKKWDYKNTNETHIGPTSEEFIETFGVGNGMDTSHLGTIDVSGVALKGVQALIEKVEDLKTVNSNYQNQLEQQQQMIQTLLSRIEALENQ